MSLPLTLAAAHLLLHCPHSSPPLPLAHPSGCSTPGVRELRLYDVAPTAGVAADLSHIATPARVSAHTGPDALGDALYGADLVVIPAGVPRKPGMTRDDLFNINAGAGCGAARSWG